MDKIAGKLLLLHKEFLQKGVTFTKNLEGYGGKYSYLSLDSLLAIVTPIMTELGIIYTSKLVVQGDTTLLSSQLIDVNSGEYFDSSIPISTIIHEMKAEKTGMSEAQVWGSYMTYFRRYSLCLILGIAAELDDDASLKNPTPGQQRTAARVKKLGEVFAFFEKARISKESLLAAIGVAESILLNSSDFDRIMEILRKAGTQKPISLAGIEFFPPQQLPTMNDMRQEAAATPPPPPETKKGTRRSRYCTECKLPKNSVELPTIVSGNQGVCLECSAKTAPALTKEKSPAVTTPAPAIFGECSLCPEPKEQKPVVVNAWGAVGEFICENCAIELGMECDSCGLPAFDCAALNAKNPLMPNGDNWECQKCASKVDGGGNDAK